MKKSKVMIAHGETTHSLEDKDDCLFCLEVEIEFLQAMKKAGGKTKFIKNLKKDTSVA